jgi:hypothetical protein
MKNVKLPLVIFLYVVTFAVSGCNSMITNNTPAQIPQNGSEIYTIAMSVNPDGTYSIPNSYSARIVVDGEVHKMEKSNDFEYSYDYARSADQHKVYYYYEIDYKKKVNGNIRRESKRSKLYNLIIANRYVIGFESNRGIPGSAITLLGRGFERGDYVEIDGVPCETSFVSPNSLSFVVPILGHGNRHHAKLVSDNGDIGLGVFHIDRVSFQSSLSDINLESGEKQALMLTINFDAPQEGIVIDATTNIPDSIIMRDIFIPAGARSTSVVIRGGAAGSGMLYLTAGGFEELKIPVEVISSNEGINAAMDDTISYD